jgi:hypothetical protein
MSEVANGELKRYFGNSTDILAPEAVQGLQRIGRPELAAALLKALSLLGESYPREREVRSERVAALTGEYAATAQVFSSVPKWVATQVGMGPAQTPFAEMKELLGAPSISVKEAMDISAGTQAA